MATGTTRFVQGRESSNSLTYCLTFPYLPWEEWRKTVTSKDADATWDHIAHSPNCSIEKAARLIGYAPRYTSMEAVCESVDWLAEHGWQA